MVVCPSIPYEEELYTPYIKSNISKYAPGDIPIWHRKRPYLCDSDCDCDSGFDLNETLHDVIKSYKPKVEFKPLVLVNNYKRRSIRIKRKTERIYNNDFILN